MFSQLMKGHFVHLPGVGKWVVRVTGLYRGENPPPLYWRSDRSDGFRFTESIGLAHRFDSEEEARAAWLADLLSKMS